MNENILGRLAVLLRMFLVGVHGFVSSGTSDELVCGGSGVFFGVNVVNLVSGEKGENWIGTRMGSDEREWDR